MINLFDKKLREIDHRILELPLSEIPHLFKDIPLDIFGELLLGVPERFPNIRTFFPTMASDEVQMNWTGAHGQTLLFQSLAFTKSLVTGYHEISGQEFGRAKVLDYGCGWGRLIRLLYKYVPVHNIYGVDPWDESIKQCLSHGVLGSLKVSEWLPKRLPFDEQFDVIYAFSVFTHLSQKTTSMVLETLRRYMFDKGVLAITIRPKEYWHIHNGGANACEMIEAHDAKGFAFLPHKRDPIEGEITYGDASMSLAYLENTVPQWKVARVEFNLTDPFQVIVFLQPD